MKLKNYFNPKVFASHASLNLFVLLSLILVAWRLAHVTVGVIAQQWLPYQGFFSYRSDMDPYQPGEYVRSMANFDGIFYIRIALKGYSMTEQAYFPLYPLLLAGLTYLLNNPMHAGLLLSNGCFALGFVFFYRYLGTTITASRRKWIILSLLTYPTAHYFGVLYTESLFFLLFFAGLFFLKNKRFLWAAGCAYALSLTRVTGVLFCIPALFFLIQELIPNKIHSLRSLFREMLLRWKYVLIFLASIAGILTYAGYLWTSVGDPLYFLKAQESFGANRSSHFITPLQVLYRYSKIFTTADYSFQYAVAILEAVFFLFAISVLGFAFWKIWKLRHQPIQIPFEQLGILLFSLAILIIPSLTGTLTAIPRYSLSAYGIFITLGLYCSKRTLTALIAVFVLLQIFYIASFVQGYYVT